MEVNITIKPGPFLPEQVLERLAKQAEGKGISADEHVAMILTIAAESEPQPNATV